MESLYILIPIAVVFVSVAIGIFLWAVRSDQFDDLERRGYDILLDKDESLQSSRIPKQVKSPLSKINKK